MDFIRECLVGTGLFFLLFSVCIREYPIVIGFLLLLYGSALLVQAFLFFCFDLIRECPVVTGFYIFLVYIRECDQLTGFRIFFFGGGWLYIVPIILVAEFCVGSAFLFFWINIFPMVLIAEFLVGIGLFFPFFLNVYCSYGY